MHAEQAQIAFSRGRAVQVHNDSDDPPRLASACTSKEEALFHYRRARDEIRACVESLPGTLPREMS